MINLLKLLNNAAGQVVALGFTQAHISGGGLLCQAALLCNVNRDANKVRAITCFVNQLCASGHSLAAVVSNAGVALGGPVEDLPMSLFREVFEVNFFGAVASDSSSIARRATSNRRRAVKNASAVESSSN